MAQETYQCDRTMTPLPERLTPPEAADAATIHVLELPQTLDLAVEKLRAVGGEWFHHLQMESIGVGLRKSSIWNPD
jgi:hypothetical protein